MRIFVIEDNREVACQIRATFEQEFYAVDIAHDGEAGWFLEDTKAYDAAILDLAFLT